MKDESWLEASILEISKAHLFNVEGGQNHTEAIGMW